MNRRMGFAVVGVALLSLLLMSPPAAAWDWGCTLPADGSKPPDWARDEHGKPLGACPQGTSCSNQGYCRRLEQ